MEYYLWSRIKKCNLPLGSKVDQGILTKAMGTDVSDKTFMELVDVGSIRENPYPVPNGYPGSPRQFYLDSIEAVAGEKMDSMMAILALAEFESKIASKPRPAVIGAESATGAVVEDGTGPSPDATKVMTPPA